MQMIEAMIQHAIISGSADQAEIECGVKLFDDHGHGCRFPFEMRCGWP